MTKFQKTKKLVSRHTKDFQAISEHILLQNCGVRRASKIFPHMMTHLPREGVFLCRKQKSYIILTFADKLS